MKIENSPKDILINLSTTIITKTVLLLSNSLKIDEKLLWKLVYSVIQELDKRGIKFYLKGDITSSLNKNTKYLDTKVKTDVGQAIEDYKDLTEEEPYPIVPIFSDIKEGETPLGGELGFTYTFVDKEEET